MRVRSMKVALMACLTSTFAGLLLFLNSPSPAASPALPEIPEDDWQVLCGDEIPLQPFVADGTLLRVMEWTNAPEGSHDEEIGELLRNPDSLLPAFAAALVAHLKKEGAFHDLSCGPCEDPNQCFIWLTGWEPAPVINYSWGEYGNKIFIEADILNDFFVTAMCTDC